MDGQTGLLGDRQIGRQAYRHTDERTHRQADGQTNKHRCTYQYRVGGRRRAVQLISVGPGQVQVVRHGMWTGTGEVGTGRDRCLR